MNISKVFVLALSGGLAAAPASASDEDFFAALRGIQRLVGTQMPADVKDPVQNPFLEQLNQARRSVYAMAESAVVQVHGGASAGSGFVVDPKGIVLTNNHVAAAASKPMTITFADGRTFGVSVLAQAPGRDIAILRIDDAFDDWDALPWGTSADKAPGDIVFALGNPTDLGISFNQGTLSRLRQDKGSNYVEYVQSDLQISAGNSGGPLLDHTGRIIGMNTAIAGTGGRLAFSIPAEDLRAAVDEYAASGTLQDGFFGASLHPASGHRDESPVPLVIDVVDGSEAQKAGLEVGDTIVGADGKPLKDSFHANNTLIERRFTKQAVGTTVRLSVKKAQDVTIAAGPTKVAAKRVVDQGIVVLGPGNQRLLQMLMMFGGGAGIQIELADGTLVAAEAEDIPQDGSFAIFRLDAAAKPAAQAAAADVAVINEAYKVTNHTGISNEAPSLH